MPLSTFAVQGGVEPGRLTKRTSTPLNQQACLLETTPGFEVKRHSPLAVVEVCIPLTHLAALSGAIDMNDFAP